MHTSWTPRFFSSVRICSHVGRVEASVAHSAEPVPGALAAAGFEWGDAGERGERCFVADASAMGPADQELGGHDRSDTGFGQQRGPGRVLRDEDQQLDIQLSGLVDQEPDTSGDRAKRSDRDPMLNGGSGWAGEPVDPVQLLGQPEPSQLGS